MFSRVPVCCIVLVIVTSGVSYSRGGRLRYPEEPEDPTPEPDFHGSFFGVPFMNVRGAIGVFLGVVALFELVGGEITGSSLRILGGYSPGGCMARRSTTVRFFLGVCRIILAGRNL